MLRREREAAGHSGERRSHVDAPLKGQRVRQFAGLKCSNADMAPLERTRYGAASWDGVGTAGPMSSKSVILV
ncbi:hypothetical protein E1H18_324 [Caulobacter sp. RHG1]|nr:hypothetical protein [Caulobacter sp. RHG1]